MYKVECLSETQFKPNRCLYRGDIVLIDFGKQEGSVQGGLRPAIVLQNDTGNFFSTTTIVALLTSQNKKNLPTHVKINCGEGGLSKNSIILMEQVHTVSKSKIIKLIGHVTNPAIYEQMRKALLISFSI